MLHPRQIEELYSAGKPQFSLKLSARAMQVDGGSGGAKQYNGFGDAVVKIVQRKGIVGGLYTGIDAAYLRQWTYGRCAPGDPPPLREIGGAAGA